MLSVSAFAVPASVTLISFLAYTSQFLFLYLEPHPLSTRETAIFNILTLCVLLSYFRACTTDPGRIPAGWSKAAAVDGKPPAPGPRWCRKCEAHKPPRAHHCKICKRCIPKMDHHCPWTINCVSHVTYPHFLRFVFYSVAAMSHLEYLLYVRASILWRNRHMPSYLGPSAWQLAHLMILVVVNSVSWLAIFILLVRTLWNHASNTTTIEGWEIERHEALLRRARHFGGYLTGPDGIQVKITRQEFPYDVGIWQNLKQGMGTGNVVLAWFWPFAKSPSIENGLDFEVNGFEDPSLPWPPPDPDRIPRARRHFNPEEAFVHKETNSSGAIDVEAFRKRQQEDQKRWDSGSPLVRRRPFHARFENSDDEEASGPDVSDAAGGNGSGEEGWRNSEGERLRDFGVEEETEFYDAGFRDDDVPLAELMRKRGHQLPL